MSKFHQIQEDTIEHRGLRCRRRSGRSDGSKADCALENPWVCLERKRNTLEIQ